MKKVENILLVRTDRIGDVVLSLPLAKIIKQKYPNFKITFLVKEYTKGLLSNHPYIDNILILKEKSRKILFKENIGQLKKYSFDNCIIVNPTLKMAIILFLSKIKNRIGSGYRWYSFLFNKKIYEHRKYGEKHELEFNINLLKEINIDFQPTYKNIDFDIQIEEKTKHLIEKFLKDFSIKNKFVIVHPGSGGSAIDLPLPKYSELIKYLTEELNLSVLLTGLENEKILCNSLVNNNNVINCAGLFNLQQLIALINKCKLLISNSTGPIHIAAALGKYVIGFYPKIKACSSNRWGPYTDKKIIVVPPINCSNCTRKQCEKIKCMETIEIVPLFDKIKNIIEFTN
ncbi:MAG: glycosyltransferase family 9 protein [Ignavibacteriales bacterium]|nr:glycosyltransferase family 9 protein [Ignavibacteriales bacterium]